MPNCCQSKDALKVTRINLRLAIIRKKDQGAGYRGRDFHPTPVARPIGGRLQAISQPLHSAVFRVASKSDYGGLRTSTRLLGSCTRHLHLVRQVLMVIDRLMPYEPRDADEQHEQHEHHEDPQLNGSVLAPSDPAQPFA
jgi:hypothetical protein